MSYIDIDEGGAAPFEVAVAMHQTCDAAWAWDHAPAQQSVWTSSVLLWLVTGGSATLQVDGVSYQAVRGACFVMPIAGHSSRGRHDPAAPLELSWLSFTRGDSRGGVDGVKGIPLYTALTDLPIAVNLMQRLLSSTGVMQAQWLHVLLDEVRRQSLAQGQPLAVRQMQALAEQIQAAPGRYRSLAEMQADFPYSKDHLIRLFRQQHGVSPYEFLIRARIDSARGLLLASDASLKQIAAQLGYADAFCFSRQFKARTGVAPSVFRR